jgi:hypothetical protein
MPSKTAKDSNAPKKALTAYMLFSADERPKLKATGLDNFAEMNKALGAAWKKADQEIRVKSFCFFLKMTSYVIICLGSV